jgi:hypothetical protein
MSAALLAAPWGKAWGSLILRYRSQTRNNWEPGSTAAEERNGNASEILASA